MFSHIVYFDLIDKSAEKVEELINACNKYLTDHDGTVFYSAGPRCEDMQRDVNDQDFDVALHVIFENKDQHDAYQVAERHLSFIAEGKPNWDRVRVFDAFC